MKKLTAKEEEIMNIFWQHGPMFIREMLAFYKEPKPHYNTVATLVKLLVEKGFRTQQNQLNVCSLNTSSLSGSFAGIT